jgi:hypothetical protein
MEEYNLANDWNGSDEELHRPQGWARRPNGPAEMREQLEIKFPGYYCYRSDKISAMVYLLLMWFL